MYCFVIHPYPCAWDQDFILPSTMVGLICTVESAMGIHAIPDRCGDMYYCHVLFLLADVLYVFAFTEKYVRRVGAVAHVVGEHFKII